MLPALFGVFQRVSMQDEAEVTTESRGVKVKFLPGAHNVFTCYIYLLSFNGRSEPFLYFNTFLRKRVFESATILDNMQSSHRQNLADPH